MSPFDDSTSDMSGDPTSMSLVESLGGSADPADRAVAELFRSAKQVFGAGPVPEIGHALARFLGTATAEPGGVAATAASRVRWLPKTAAKILLGLALATGSLTTAYAAGVVDFGSLFDDVDDDLPVPVSEPSTPPTPEPSSTTSIYSESIVPETTEVEQHDSAMTVPNSSGEVEPTEPTEPTEATEATEATEVEGSGNSGPELDDEPSVDTAPVVAEQPEP